MVYSRTVLHTLTLSQAVIVSNQSTVPFYGTLEEADNFHGQMLEGQLWEYTERSKRVKALVSATRRIEQLNFAGSKTDESQFLQFPRGGDTTVPVSIRQATYVLALKLLEGVDPETEADNALTTLQGYGNLRTEKSGPPVYVVAGIPSYTAWSLLLPYLRERRELYLERR